MQEWNLGLRTSQLEWECLGNSKRSVDRRRVNQKGAVYRPHRCEKGPVILERRQEFRARTFSEYAKERGLWNS